MPRKTKLRRFNGIDVNLSVVDRDDLARANFIAFAKLNLTVNFDDTRGDQRATCAAAIGKSTVFEQMIELDVLLRQLVFDGFHFTLSMTAYAE
jgi:hypothetical protein